MTTVDAPADDLALTAEDVARLTRPQREARVETLTAYSYSVLERAVRENVTELGKELVATAVLYSGGNDSTVLAHLFRGRATHAIHANTGIGVEATRTFVRETCATWNLPLIEKSPAPGNTYRELVVDQGFPGPAHHWKMYQRLKERALDAARRDLVIHNRRQRIVLLAGRRRSESQRRADVPEVERDGSAVWVSPLVFWTPLDLSMYRLMTGDVPVNEVSAKIHMSGECLCGAFAEKGELDEIGYWFPEVRAHIERLEAEVAAAGNAPAWRCRWGWGADKSAIQKLIKEGHDPDLIAEQFRRSESGRLCTTCASR